jgi:UDP-N-acetyl-D-glucosamine dehydrogenase
LFIDAAEQVNSHMPAYNADRIAAILNDEGKAVLDTEILAVGISYKPDIADDRESASLQVLTELERRGARISVLDPEVSRERIEEHGYAHVSGDESFARFQLAAILTDHTDIDYPRIVDEVPLVYDARGVFRRLGIESKNITAL